MALKLTAIEFVKRLKRFQSAAELKKYERYFPLDKRTDGDEFAGVRMGHVFETAKEFIDMPVGEIEKLMESSIHEVRAGALSIMGKSAAAKKTSPERLKELYDLYLRRHDRINNWDLVDLAAHQVVGRYLADKPRKVLDKLARSKDQWERRTAILATAHFILKLKEADDTFKIAGMLVNDKEEFVNKGVGWMLRAAGDVDRERLKSFLDKHAATMPRVTLRAALEHFEKQEREYYLGMKKRLDNQE
jgi:3-methyladenine DNA glycosylase AlkD